MMHVPATGLISPWGTNCLGQVRRKEESVLGTDWLWQPELWDLRRL